MDVGWNRRSAGLWPSSFRTTVHLRPARSIFLWRCELLSVAKLALGQEAYYEQQVALGLDDYYAGRGESPGLWAGSGAEGLELSGVIADGDLGTLLRGVSPADGERLRAPARQRTITVRTLDEATGVWSDEPKTLAPVAGYDLVFSCPKSVSLLHALTDDEQVRRTISDAHEASWRAALAYLESEAGVVRRGRGGQVREHGEGFVAAAYRHRTSRAQDPHLHTHVIIANLARSADGRWRALDGEAVLRTYRLAAGYLYEANLRGELSRTLGVRWTMPVKGMAEIEGVSTDALRAFSTRRQSLVEHMEAMGTSGFAASRVAALATRERKEGVDLPDLRGTWLCRAAEMGLGVHELRGLLDREPAREPQLATIGADGLTEHQATITTPEIVCAVAGAAREGASVEAVLAGVERMIRGPEVTLVEDGAPGRPGRFTTRSLLDLERQALRVALLGCGGDAPRADPVSLAMALRDAPLALSAEQRTLVEATALSPDRVVCVVGVAGAGKTTALRALGDALAHSGVPMLGAAPSGRAADELARAAQIEAVTLHRLLADAARAGGLPRGCVLVIDEAGMADTRVLSPALALVEEAGGKAILVGDPAQLPAVGAGGLYATLCDRLGAVRLTENRRQREPAEREALARLRGGDAEPYLGHAARDRRLHLADDATQAKGRLLNDWWHAAAEGGLRGVVMLAHRRADVAELNEGARALLRRVGWLGDQELVAGGRDFRAGDRVICRQNDSTLKVCNGTRATVRAVDPDRGLITLHLDGGPIRQLPLRYAAEHLDHGYALTGHAAQGLTVDRAFVLVRPDGALAEWGYVTASRARIETRLYAVDAEPVDNTALTPNDAEPTTRRLTAALMRPAAEPPAVSTLEAGSAGPEPAQLERERLRREIASQGRLLVSTRQDLASLGWIGRRRHGPALRAQIDDQLHVLADLQLALRDLPAPAPRPPPPALDRPPALRARERPLRQPVERGMGLDR
jgi:conjugative relaxase-like TrwC/TraI family protein